MAMVTVKGTVLWTKHIHGDSALRDRLAQLPAGEDIELLVDGVRGYWRKMSTGRDGRPTPGLSPRGRMQAVWTAMNTERRGEDVAVAEPPAPIRSYADGPAETLEERMAAARELVSITGRSEPGWKFNRQDVYDERDDELAARRARASLRDRP